MTRLAPFPAVVFALLVGAPAGAAARSIPSIKATKVAARTAPPIVALQRGYLAYRAGDYEDAVVALPGVAGHGLHIDDWATFLLAESEFYSGAYRAARGHFERAAKGHGRPAEMAPARVADCLWMEGARAKATAAYARVVKAAAHHASPFVDVGVARFRVAETTAARDPAGGRRLYLAFAKDLPAHPLSDEALRRAAPPDIEVPPPVTTPSEPQPAEPKPGATPKSSDAKTGEAKTVEAKAAEARSVDVKPRDAKGALLAPEDRLRRAESLTRDRHWDEALAELDKLPKDLPPAIATERDFQIGMTKFHMRRDYARAAELLLGAAPHLIGEKSAEAAFHGARALSRVDRDEEAIKGYRKVVEQFPRSHWAAEAQYLSGWLDYNRGRFRESLPGLQATLDHYGGSAFADDAAWCLAFAHLLLGDADEAFAGLTRYSKMPATGMTGDERAAQVAYWRARLHEKLGHAADAEAGYRALVHDKPLSFYGLLATKRLRDAKLAVEIVLPTKLVADAEPPPHLEREPIVLGALELLDAHMNVEAGEELQRAEKDLLARAGRQNADKTVAWLLECYRRIGDFHRAYQLADSRGGGALAAAPTGGARVFWEAAYPRAYAELVDKYGPPAGNPDVLLYAIMRKESGFNPLDVSYADARGLLQMIPPTSARVAATAKLSFAPDELYEPETNVRLGAIYIGSLYEKFGGQVPLAAGAYNAGPRAMTKWCDQHGGRPTDEFVELIAFAQTREYAKRVTALYAHYRYLYGDKPYEIPLTLNTKPAPTGPDY